MEEWKNLSYPETYKAIKTLPKAENLLYTHLIAGVLLGFGVATILLSELRK